MREEDGRYDRMMAEGEETPAGRDKKPEKGGLPDAV